MLKKQHGVGPSISQTSGEIEIDLETDIFIKIEDFFEQIFQQAFQKKSYKVLQILIKVNPFIQLDGKNVLQLAIESQDRRLFSIIVPK